ncbi:MAG TPA: hypothetical protein VLF66_15210 [Thermoanaerobaculia bacterium]|nr:hypothetical protein [Thermoanaerobaculia bacterium]
MAEQRERLQLYEALELRAELDARIKTIKDCLPEARQNRGGFLSYREDKNRRPSPDFDLEDARKRLKRLELRRRKLNAAIQQTNFQHRVEHDGESMTLAEALEVRKGLNEAIGELHSQLVESAWQRVIYKEDRDIVEESDLSYSECSERLETARLAFRSLNRRLRAASFDASVEFADE